MTGHATPQQPTASVPVATRGDSAATVAEVLLPVISRGAIVRRPPMVRLAERLDLDRRAVHRMQRLRETYGPGPVRLRLPGREFAVILSRDHVRRVLDDSPEPFATANLEKRVALSRFQPHGVLISHGPERAERRRFNEEVLDAELPIHRMAYQLLDKVVDEADHLRAGIDRSGRLTWDDFSAAWWRVIRRVVLGDAARQDHALTDYLGELRAAANWSYLRPGRPELRRRFERQLDGHLERAEPGSLAGAVADVPDPHGDRAVARQQVPQWLFAYDAANWAAFRALALISAHPEAAAPVRDELEGQDLREPHDLPFLRACVLESLRLWPTTPAVLRDTTVVTEWDTGLLPEGSGVLVFAPFFHRDDTTMPFADRFAPETWLDGRTLDRDWPLIPFSAGPAVCPGRHLVLLTVSTMLGRLLSAGELHLDPPHRLDPGGRLPSVLSPFHLQFRTTG